MHETWEEDVLAIIRGKGGPITVQEIYREIERHPLVKTRHRESWGGQPNFHHWVRSYLAKLKKRRDIRHIGRGLYVAN